MALLLTLFLNMVNKKPAGTPSTAKKPAEQASASKHSVAHNKETVTRIVEGVDQIAQKISPRLKGAISNPDSLKVSDFEEKPFLKMEFAEFFLTNEHNFENAKEQFVLFAIVDFGFDCGIDTGNINKEDAGELLDETEEYLRAARTLMKGDFEIYAESGDYGKARINFVLPLGTIENDGEINEGEIAMAAKKIAETLTRLGGAFSFEDDRFNN